MYEKIKNIISEKLDVNPDTITLETSYIDDLDVDSIELVELIMRIEDEFNIEIEDEQAEKIKTVDDTVKYLEKCFNK